MKQLNKLSVSALEEEIRREKYKSKYIKILKSTIYALIIIAGISCLVATFVMPVLEVSDTTMKPLLNNNDIVLSVKTKKFDRQDIIAFYQGNKILIKRVIGVPGDWINMDDDGNVSVNGNVLEEDYISNKQLGDVNIEFPYQVLDNEYFVLSDERDKMIDSRNEDIGLIKKDNIIGKVIFRVWPFKEIGVI